MIASLPNKNRNLPFRTDGFRTVLEALDYAAAGETGFSFYTPRGDLSGTLTFSQLRERSLDLAQRLVGAGLKKGDRVAMIAESTPDFFTFF